MKSLYTLAITIILQLSILQAQKIQDSKYPKKFIHLESARNQAEILIKEENEDRSPDSVLFQNYDRPNSKWVNSFKVINEFDPNGNNTLTYVYYWNDTLTQWYNVFREIKAYDQQNRRVYFEYSGWDMLSVQWVYEWKLITSHSDTASVTLHYTWNKADSIWMLDDKTQTNYNENKWVTGYFYFNINPSDSTWNNEHKELITYDSVGHIILDNHFDWDQSSREWKQSNKIVLTYDTKGNLTERLTTMPVLFTDRTSTYKQIYFYNEDNLRIGGISYKWDMPSGLWINQDKSETSYINDTLTESLGYYWQEEQWVKNDRYQYIEKDNYDLTISSNFIGDEEAFSYRYYNFYPEMIVNTENPEIQDMQLFLYPNPVTSGLTVRVNGGNEKDVFVSLIDLRGTTVFSGKVRNGSLVSLETIPKGLYICKVNFDGRTYTDKILVK
ncbi:MAG TPA: T9SS type A sorting domain-containing protein [Bacteroidales bacterium]|nr:T9SS type A sorting domain-containing protein [Bacteroidales bacterium]